MMKIQVLGGHGGQSPGFAMTSFLIDDRLLIDAGSVASAVDIPAQMKIDHILISHCHLDHIKDLAFLSDNCFGLKDRPFQVYTHKTVKKIIKDHLLNDVVWPDFTVLPSPEKPTMTINAVEEEKTLTLGEYKVTPVKVKHAHDAMGFIIEKGDSAVLFTLDTGPTDRIWEIARGIKNLKAIFTEVSFPNSLSKVAELSEHHTPHTIQQEMKKMPANIPIILSHLKPNYQEMIVAELKTVSPERIRIIENDGEIFNF